MWKVSNQKGNQESRALNTSKAQWDASKEGTRNVGQQGERTRSLCSRRERSGKGNPTTCPDWDKQLGGNSIKPDFMYVDRSIQKSLKG